MSYIANQYNYATPLSSTTGLFGEASVVTDKKYFALSDNVLDGSYYLITGDVGLWGAAASDANGNLATPFEVTFTETLTVNAFRLTGSSYCYPVAFTVVFYNGSTALYTISETANTKHEYIHYLPHTVEATSYKVTITKVSKAGSAARLYNTYNPAYVKRVDTLRVDLHDTSDLSAQYYIGGADTLLIVGKENKDLIVPIQSADEVNITGVSKAVSFENTVHATDSFDLVETTNTFIHNTAEVADALRIIHDNSTHILNTIDKTFDTVKPTLVPKVSHVTNIIDVTRDKALVKSYDAGWLVNVHTIMKRPSRQVFGKVYITYTDPMLDATNSVITTSEAYNSERGQVLDSLPHIENLYFTLYDNDLSGKYVVSSEHSQVGWSSAALSKADGTFDIPQSIELKFSSRPITLVKLSFDEIRDNVFVDFTMTYTDANGAYTTYTITGNNQAQLEFGYELSNIVSVKIEVTKISRGLSPAVLVDVPIMSTFLYKGYDEISELMSIDLLEELTYEDEVEALGGVSANEITVVLDNSSKNFFFNSDSLISKQLKRNRKIVPWLGVEVIPGEIEWYTLGTFWSYRWDVPVNGLTTTVVGFDTIGLLGLTLYSNHQTQINKSIGQLIEYVLEDAKLSLDFIEYKIDASLYDVIIPYAWFSYASHAEALRKLSLCYPLHIYCNRDGVICASPQRIQLDYYYDTWSDSTNVHDKSYSSLYTALPNVVTVQVNRPVILTNESLVEDDTSFIVTTGDTKSLNFNKPYLSDLAVSVECDNGVQYTYTVYSWGIMFSFTGMGTVRKITCTGSCVDISESSIITKRKELSVLVDGQITREVQSDFIQTNELANFIIDRFFKLSANDIYDATVNYRGDIALSINDPILLQDGIAPDNRYVIKRHQLFWNGALTGSAELNT